MLELQSPRKVRRSPGARAQAHDRTPAAEGSAATGFTPVLRGLSIAEHASPSERAAGFTVASPAASRARPGRHLEEDGPAPPTAAAGEAGDVGRRLFRARGLRLFAVTWNLAGRLPPASIASIAPDQDFEARAPAPPRRPAPCGWRLTAGGWRRCAQIFAIGTQECMVQCGSVKVLGRPAPPRGPGAPAGWRARQRLKRARAAALGGGQSFVQTDKGRWEQRLQV